MNHCSMGHAVPERQGQQGDHLSVADQQVVEEFAQFLTWAGPAQQEHAPFRHLAAYWYDGLLTIKEGRLIEEGRTL